MDWHTALVSLTLQSLKSMKVSDGSACLSACVGTNLNNDGISRYVATAALFLSQGLGLGEQAVIAMAPLRAGTGISGVPGAGLIVLLPVAILFDPFPARVSE